MRLAELKPQGPYLLGPLSRTRDGLSSVFMRTYGFIIFAKKDILTPTPDFRLLSPSTRILVTLSAPAR